MNCPSCGRELKSIKSLIRGRGYRCSCKRKEVDKEQIKLNFEEGKDDGKGKLPDIRNKESGI
jgi:tRNA(Ile2) C34 agmatinyltransferase TiaS